MPADPVDPEDALIAATRELVDLVRTMDEPGASATDALRAVRVATAALAPHRHPGPYQQAALKEQPTGFDERDPARMFPYSPVVGPQNPLAPPIVLRLVGERMTGRMNLGPAYVGPPGTVHGGVVALVFDELLGVTNVAHGVGAMTGTLSIRYHAPTPLGVDVDLEAWVDRIEGRKIFTHGRMFVGDATTATCEGVFVRPRPEST